MDLENRIVGKITNHPSIDIPHLILMENRLHLI